MKSNLRISISVMYLNRSLEQEFCSGGPSLMRDILTNSGKLALRLLEDLTALAAGGSVCADMGGSSSCLKDIQNL